jgi:hypothetical protein
MYVIVVGNPLEGFDVAGPLDQSDDASTIGEWVRGEYGGSDFYQCKLTVPPEDGVSVDKAGTFVVINCSIVEPFEFFGPFADYEAAMHYVEHYVGGWAVMLNPIDREDIEVAA